MHLAAAQEAYEEGGVIGIASPGLLGTYSYFKRRPNGRYRQLHVDVFPLRVMEEAQQWPEQHQRERRWFTQADAADAVEEAELRAMIAQFKPSLALAGPDTQPGNWFAGGIARLRRALFAMF